MKTPAVLRRWAGAEPVGPAMEVAQAEQQLRSESVVVHRTLALQHVWPPVPVAQVEARLVAAEVARERACRAPALHELLTRVASDPNEHQNPRLTGEVPIHQAPDGHRIRASVRQAQRQQVRAQTKRRPSLWMAEGWRRTA